MNKSSRAKKRKSLRLTNSKIVPLLGSELTKKVLEMKLMNDFKSTPRYSGTIRSFYITSTK